MSDDLSRRLAELTAALDRPALTEDGQPDLDLALQIAQVREDLGNDHPALAALLTRLETRLAQDNAARDVQTQMAQHARDHYADRLVGMRPRLAKAVEDLFARKSRTERWYARRAFDRLMQSRDPLFPEECPEAARKGALDLIRHDPPAIDVVLPTRNRAKPLMRAITSALLQSLAPRKVLVIDDGSTDATSEMIAARFAPYLASGQLEVVKTIPQGAAAARNEGLRRAEGDLVAYLDSDNLWAPDCLLYLSAALARQPERDSAYGAICRHNLDDHWSDILYCPFDRSALEQENFIDLNVFVHRRSNPATGIGFDTGLTRLIDWDFILTATRDRAPIAVPVIGGHHVVSTAALGNITRTEPLEPNLAQIRRKLDG
ncbi:glycosyltransferase [Aestuariibius insulae]|uniref:glycosyltransferase family A protein n=1 Tax=Aestuariibius insulae TaxID=2058287 RepID=UPI00345E79B4